MITSLENKEIKKYLKLKKKKYRDLEKLFLVEGEHLIKEAEKSNSLVKVILTEDKELETNKEILYVTHEIMKKLSNLDTPPEMIGVCKINDNKKVKGNIILALDDIQDPGNLGTIIRSAVAFNIKTILLSENTVDLYNPKVLRSTQGLLFYTNIIRCDLEKKLKKLKEEQYSIYVTNVEEGKEISKMNVAEKLVLVMGNEGNGVSSNIKSLKDENIYIKTNNLVESLNVGVATSILLYELDSKVGSSDE